MNDALCEAIVVEPYLILDFIVILYNDIRFCGFRWTFDIFECIVANGRYSVPNI